MISLKYSNNILEYQGDNYQISSIEKIEENYVNVHIYSEIYNCILGLFSYDTSINDVIQTSADMIIETLSNG